MCYKNFMTKIKTVCLQIALTFALTLSVTSCASAKLHVKDKTKYSNQKIDYKVELFSLEKHSLSHNLSSLELSQVKFDGKSKIPPQLKEFAAEQGTQAFTGTFVSNKENRFATSLVYSNESNSATIITGPEQTKITVQNAERIVSFANPLPIVITRANEYDLKGKTYTLDSEFPYGMRIYVYGEEYALADLNSYPAQFLLNKEFSRELSSSEQDFLESVIFAAYDYLKTSKDKTKTGLSTYYSSY